MYCSLLHSSFEPFLQDCSDTASGDALTASFAPLLLVLILPKNKVMQVIQLQMIVLNYF